MTTLVFGLLAFLAGMMSILGYVLYRMMQNPDWDDSNLTNALRLLSHVTLHPMDFPKMQYPDGSRPFWYVTKDEFSEVVKTRPQKSPPSEDEGQSQ